MINLCTDHRNNGRIYISILEQNEKKIQFKASNGWTLVTSKNPEIKKDTKVFFLQGKDETKNHRKMLVSKETFNEIIEAVNEYNETCIRKSKTKAKKESKKEFYLAIEEDGDIINEKDFDSFDKAIKEIKSSEFNYKVYIYKRVAEVEPIETIEYKITKF